MFDNHLTKRMTLSNAKMLQCQLYYIKQLINIGLCADICTVFLTGFTNVLCGEWARVKGCSFSLHTFFLKIKVTLLSYAHFSLTSSG